MPSRNTQIAWKTVLPLVLGLLAFLLYIYIFNVDIFEMIATLQRVDLTIYSLAILALLSGTLFFSLSWRYLLNYLSVKLSIMKSVLYVWFGIFIDIMIPAESISGEISMAYLVTREDEGASGKVVASLVTQRLIGTSINIVGLIMGIVALFTRRQITGLILNLILFLTVGTTISFVLLIFFCIKKKWTLTIVDAIVRFIDYISRGRWKLANIRNKIVIILNAYRMLFSIPWYELLMIFICSIFFHRISRRCLILARIIRPFFNPGPRNESTEVRFALSKLDLKIKAILSFWQIAFTFFATDKHNSSDSITQGPAIKTKGLSLPILILPNLISLLFTLSL